MIPNTEKLSLKVIGVLHVCGDDPNMTANILDKKQCSPRMWR